MRKVIYSKFNKVRKPQYQLITSVVEIDGIKQVEKKIGNAEANNHLNSLLTAYERNKVMYKNIIPLQGKKSGEKITYPFLSGFSAASFLSQYINDIDILCKKIDYYINEIMIYNEDNYCDFYETEKFKNIFGNSNGYSGKALKNTDIDLTLDNLLLFNEKWYSYDYEWTFDFPIPVDFMKFRIIYRYYSDNIIHFKDIISHIEFAKKFGISRENTELFEQWEFSFLKYVYGDKYQYIYTDNYQKKTIDLQGLIKTYGNLEDAFNARNESIWTYEKVKKDLDDEILKNHNTIQDKQNEINQHKKEIKDKQKKIEKQQAELNRQQEEIKKLKNELEVLKDQYNTFKNNSDIELKKILREYQNVCAQYDDVVSSKIWTMSKPIRTMLDGK